MISAVVDAALELAHRALTAADPQTARSAATIGLKASPATSPYGGPCSKRNGSRATRADSKKRRTGCSRSPPNSATTSRTKPSSCSTSCSTGLSAALGRDEHASDTTTHPTPSEEDNKQPQRKETDMSLTRQPSDSPTTKPPRRGRAPCASRHRRRGAAARRCRRRHLAVSRNRRAPPLRSTPTAAPKSRRRRRFPAPTTPEDEAAAAAIARYEEYARVEHSCGQGGYLDTQPLQRWPWTLDLTLQTRALAELGSGLSGHWGRASRR